MRRLTRIRIFKTALLMATFLMVFTVTFMINRTYIRKHTELVEVVVAANKLSPYSLVTRDDLTMSKRPRSVVGAEAVRDLEFFGPEKSYYTEELGFGKGDIISQDRIFETETSKLGQIVKLANENKMLLSVNTNLVRSCANMVTAGTYVDLIVYLDDREKEDSDTIISPAEDARLSSLLVVATKNSEASGIEEEGRNAIPAVVTFELTRDKMDVAKVLVKYNEKGSIYLLPVGYSGTTDKGCLAGM